MKKTVSLNKDLEFNTMIGEIVEIDLEDNLNFTSSNSIEGNFIVSGKYKITKPSTLAEDFSFNLPVDISLTENLDEKSRDVKIVDFKYQVEDDNILKVDIELEISGVETIDVETEEIEIDRECDGDDISQKEIEIPMKEEKEIEELKQEDEKEYNVEKEETIFTEDKTPVVENIDLSDDINTNSLFSNLADEDDSFATYSVYIMREGDTIEKVLEKYSITREKLEEYNDLGTLNINSKIIIPTINNE